MFLVKVETPFKKYANVHRGMNLFSKKMIKVIFVIIILLIQLPLCGNNQRPLKREGFVISYMKYLFD